MHDAPLAALVARAQGGDLAALEDLVRAIQDRIYQLALRMVGDPDDAHDATQEILVKLVTRLDSFRGASAFTTWAYSVASNHLLTARQRRAEHPERSFALLGEEIAAGLVSEAALPDEVVTDEALAEEVRLGCTLGMLQCLDRPHRLALILSEVMQVSGAEGAAILGITPEAYRQRLVRARRALRAFLQQSCGLVNASRPCRCQRQVGPSIAVGRLDPDALQFVTHPTVEAERPPAGSDPAMLARAKAVLAAGEFGQLARAGALLRSHPAYAAPDTFVAAVRRLLATERIRLFDAD